MKKKGLIGYFLMVLLWGVVTSMGAQVNAYEGKNFWVSNLAAPTFGPGASTVVTLWARTNATVVLSNPAKSFAQTVTLVANVPQQVTITAAASSHTTTETIDSFGVEITSNNNIMVSVATALSGSDGTMVFPVKNLGSEYYVMSYEGVSGPQSGSSSVIIVATENNTTVEITPSVQTSGLKPAGSPYTITLNKGKTYRLQASGTGDLTGTYIRVQSGCKPLAVFAGSTCSQVPVTCTNCDHLFEMLPHLETWGKKFLVTPMLGGSFWDANYTLKILSTANNTKVTINGTTITLNKGATHIISGNDKTASFCVEADKPILVAQFTEGFGCQSGSTPKMMFVAPAEQLVKSALIYGLEPVTTNFNHSVQIITKTTARGRLRVNGAGVTTGFSTVSSCNDWSYVNLSLGQGPHTITSDSGFIATMHIANFNGDYMMNVATNMRILRYDVAADNLTCGSLDINYFHSGDSSRVSQSVWFFDDQTTQTGKYVTKKYPAHGNYRLTNIVTYQDACAYTDTLTYSIRTLPLPLVGYTINDSVQCFKGNSFVFTDTTKYIAGSRRKETYWSYNDTAAKYIGSFNISRVYAKPGLSTLQLIAESADLCRDTFEWTVKIEANAKPDYQLTNPQCFKSHAFNPVQLSSVAGSSIIGYNWDFGDSTQSTLAVPNKRYTKDSTYQITLIARAANGCDDTLRRTFTIHPSPTAAFTTANICSNDSMRAKNLSTFSSPLTYLWKLGDGNTSTSTDIVKNYADTGNYRVVLTATTSLGCPDSAVKQVVVLPTPKPGFSFAKQCTQNPSVFTNKTFDYGIGLSTYTWKMGDSGQYTTPNVTHTYKKEGLYTISLYAKLPNGCNDSTKGQLYINPIPKTGFTINDSVQCIRDNNFSFFNGTTLSEGKIKSFTWRLNDTFWSNNVSESRIFTTHGKNTVKLVAITDSLCADSITRQIDVPPQTQLNLVSLVDTQCMKNHAFTITNNSSVPAGTVTYYWQYSSGDIDSIPQPPPKQFNAAGIYRLDFLAVTDKGCRDSLTRNFTIYPSPELDFEVNDVCGSDSARFSNFSKVATGRIVKWHWDLGDGDSSTLKHPVHKYNNFGQYDVRLIGITDLGCPDTLFVDTALTVKPAPKSKFASQLLEQRGQSTLYGFTELSNGADNFYWNFDRGQTSREPNPTFDFADTGIYHIILTVSNNDGCFDSYDTTIVVVPDIDIYIPNAFSPNKDIINPIFRIEGAYFYMEYEMNIFDRWGQRVFTSNNPDIGWDGTFDGKRMPEGIYLYSLRMIGTDTKVRIYKGSLHLLK